MQSNKLLLLSSTVMPLVLVAGVAGVAVGGAAIAAGLGAATARAQCAPKAANPCAAKPCAPNPCAAAKADPCAAANPCAVKKVAACAPCNPCAAANPCNPCAAANPCNPCGPCAAAGGASSNCVVPRLQTAAANPCAAKKVSACAPGNPCNAAKAAANPCNPCAATKAAANPCNPCAVVKAAACAPCNPCAAAKAAAGPCNPCNPCAAANPCNPCAAAGPCNPCAAAGPCNPCGASAAAELTDEEAVAVYDCLLEELAAAYAKSGNAVALNYQSWPRYSSQPYTSATHGERYVQNYANPKGRAYGAYEDAGRMPAGTALAKDSFTVDAQGRASVGPLFVMEKMDAGFNPESDDWRYTMIMPSGAVFGTTKGQGSDNVAFCIGCHMGVSQADSMLFMPEDYRVRR